MSVQDRSTLKSYFETGDKPTASNFEDLIDSFLQSGDLSSQSWSLDGNTAGDTKSFGTTDDYGLNFLQNGDTIGGFNDAQQWFFGRSAAYSDTMISFTGQGNDNSTNVIVIKNSDEDPLLHIKNGGKIGFGCEPHAQVQYALTDDANPPYITDWDERHVAYGYGTSSQAPGLGFSYSSLNNSVNMAWLQPSIQWLNARFNMRTLSIYSNGTTLGISQDVYGSLTIGAGDTGGGQRVVSIQNADFAPVFNPVASTILYCEDAGSGSRLCMRNEAGDVMTFYKESALTTALTSMTATAPGTADYAIQNLTNSGGYGFATQDEGNTVLAVIINLQTRINELESKLQNIGLLA
jgi:hypothetical protein